MDKKEACPKCGESKLLQPIPNAIRCGACGEIFNQVRDAVGEAALKRRQEGFRGKLAARNRSLTHERDDGHPQILAQLREPTLCRKR